ncbi:hypothetical protein ACFO3I_15515 [Rheinheimera marina]|uniref:Uncharacterized protein n=1 Tax=Rheinheimera marina TaxID=1774958 RepID=A0ABV9JQF1_9GAMM
MALITKRTFVWILLVLTWGLLLSLSWQTQPGFWLHLVQIPLLLVLTLGLASTSLD